MFESLADKLQKTLRDLRGLSSISESNISEAARDIRAALLEADVNFEVVREFVEAVKVKSLGAEVLRKVSPGEQLVKIVNDQLVELMGEREAPLNLAGSPAVFMMVGLHGSGKTTTAAKLAARLDKGGRSVLLVAGDVYRPAAIDQLETLGREIGVPVHSDRTSVSVPGIAAAAVERAKREGFNTVIVDTAGRLQIDEPMVKELVMVKQATGATEIMLVADAALGQEAVSVAEHFHRALGLTGVVLTKLDGDARGGAALSIRKVTGCPIKLVGVGEKIEDLETFHPDRMASRILGMGDIVSLVEKAAEEIDQEEAERLRDRLRKNAFDFNDFLGQIRQMKRMGGVESVMKYLPGGDGLLSGTGAETREFSQIEAIICSMTAVEREDPDLIDFARRKRIARGSGTTLEQIGKLVKNFSVMRKMMKKTGLVNRLMSGGLDLGSAIPGGGFAGFRERVAINLGAKKKVRKQQKDARKKNRKKH